MPALKGSRKCDPTHRKRQLTSYADRFDEPDKLPLRQKMFSDTVSQLLQILRQYNPRNGLQLSELTTCKQDLMETFSKQPETIALLHLANLVPSTANSTIERLPC
jgi:flagellar biosynthesis/type III secretory pathway chaperone